MQGEPLLDAIGEAFNLSEAAWAGRVQDYELVGPEPEHWELGRRFNQIPKPRYHNIAAATADHAELTLDEVARRLRMKAVTLRRFLGRIRFAAIQGGDTLLFTEAGYIEIREARRKCRSRSSRRVRADPSTGVSEAPSEGSISTRLQALRTGNSPKRSR